MPDFHSRRILLVTNLYPPQELGGYGRSMADFCWGLQNQGFFIQVVCANAEYLGPGGDGPSHEAVERSLRLKGDFEKGVKQITDPRVCSAIDRFNLEQLKRLLLEPWDGVLVGNLDLLGPEILPTLLQKGCPVVHHVGFMQAPYHPSAFPSSDQYRMIAASKAVRDSLVQQGLPVGDQPVVYPGARTALFGTEATGRHLPAPLSRTLRSNYRLGSHQNPLRLCYAGLLMTSKGLHTLLEAIVLLRDRQIHCSAMLAGNEFQSSYADGMKNGVNRCGLSEVVQFTGNLNREQLSRMFGLHHVGVFPSIYPEAFGIVGAEMQASGLALVSSGVGGAKELINHGVTGLLFDAGNSTSLADALAQLVESPELLVRIARNGQQQVRTQFSVQASSEALAKLLLGL